jgi:hypothetical protein
MREAMTQAQGRYDSTSRTNQPQKNQMKNIYRASIDDKVVGHYPSMSAAMKVLTSKAIKKANGYNGFVDVYDPDYTIMPRKEAEEDGYKLIRHRVVRGGDAGWYWND